MSQWRIHFEKLNIKSILLILFIVIFWILIMSDISEAFLKQERELVQAAERGDVRAVKKLLKKGADVNAQFDGQSALLHAVENEHVELVKILLEAGVDVKRKQGYHSLKHALISGYTEIAKLLLEAGANVNATYIDEAVDYYPTLLMIMIEKGIIQAVELLLEYGADVNKKSYMLNKKTALMLAAENGHTEIVKLLLQHGANISQKDKSKCTALWFAVLNSHPEVTQLLLKHGADIESKNIGNQTMLVKAAARNNMAAVEMLLANGANVNAGMYREETALTSAVKRANVEMVKLLLEHGAKVGWKAYRIAEEKKLEEIKRLLYDSVSNIFETAATGNIEAMNNFLNKGVDININDQYGCTPLMWASRNGHTNMVKLLLQHGAHINVRPKSRYTALIAAGLHDHLEIMELLIAHGADIDLKTWPHGETALWELLEWDHIEAAKLLLEHGADVETKNDYDRTILMDMADSNLITVQTLLDYGADVNAKNEKGLTALMLAAKRRETKIVKVLVEHGADINAKLYDKLSSVTPGKQRQPFEEIREEIQKEFTDSGLLPSHDFPGMTALMFAADRGNPATIQVLLEYGADVNAQEKLKGRTALMFAAIQRYPDKVKLLLKHGADVNAREYRGMTALMFAAIRRSPDVAKLLVQHGTDINVKDQYGMTALMWGVLSKDAEIVHMLLEHGADPNAKNIDGDSALRLASERGYGKIYQALFAKGAEIEANMQFMRSPFLDDNYELLKKYLPHSAVGRYATQQIPEGQLITVKNLHFNLYNQKNHAIRSKTFPLSFYLLKDDTLKFLPISSPQIKEIPPPPERLEDFNDGFHAVYTAYIDTPLPTIEEAKRMFDAYDRRIGYVRNQMVKAGKWSGLGHLYLEQGNEQLARECFLTGADDDKYNVDEEMYYGLSRMGKLEEAEKWRKNILRQRRLEKIVNVPSALLPEEGDVSFLFSVKYSYPLGAYINSKVLIGSKGCSDVFGPGGQGLFIDGGIGLKGYKLGIGHGLYAGGLCLSGDCFTCETGAALLGYGGRVVYQQGFDDHLVLEEGEGAIGVEIVGAWLVSLEAGVYRKINTSEFFGSIGLGIGF